MSPKPSSTATSSTLKNHLDEIRDKGLRHRFFGVRPTPTEEEARHTARELMRNFLEDRRTSVEGREPMGIFFVSSDDPSAETTGKVLARTVFDHDQSVGNKTKATASGEKHEVPNEVLPLYHYVEGINRVASDKDAQGLDKFSDMLQNAERMYIVPEYKERLMAQLAEYEYNYAYRNPRLGNRKIREVKALEAAETKTVEEEEEDSNNENGKMESLESVVHRTTRIVSHYDYYFSYVAEWEKEKRKAPGNIFWIVLVADHLILKILQTAFDDQDPSEHCSVEDFHPGKFREFKLN